MSTSTLENGVSPPAEPQPAAEHLQVAIPIQPRRVLTILAACIALLLVLSILGELAIGAFLHNPESPVHTLAGKFVFDSELNLPTWFSSVGLLACAMLLGGIAIARRAAHDTDWIHWAGLGAIFTAMSLDEVAALHGMASGPIRRGLDLDGTLRFAWVVLAVPVVLLIAAVYARFLWRLPSRSRMLFVAAAALYVGGALGAEVVGGVLAADYGLQHPIYLVCSMTEELLEMAGIALFLYALLDHLARMNVSLRLDLRQPTSVSSSELA